MSTVRHLSHAPIADASINFQVDASQGWNSDLVSALFTKRWSEFRLVSVLTPMEVTFQVVAGVPKPPTAEEKPVQGFLYRSEGTLLQVRRDGFTFSREAPYLDWNNLKSRSLAKWADFQDILKPNELHNIGVHFSNRLEYDVEGFNTKRFFAAPPTVPAGLNWKFYGFQQAVDFAPPDTLYRVRATFNPAFVANPGKSVAFLLTIEVFLNEPFLASGRSLDVVLEEMRALKNEAFFNLLTEEAIARYI